MIWEIDIQPLGPDPERDRVAAEFDLLTHSNRGRALVARTSRGFLMEGEISLDGARALAGELLTDPLVEKAEVGRLNEFLPQGEPVLAVLLKPGVMDPVAE